MRSCDNCGKETKNPKFCSRSCSASKTNREFIKRKFKPVKCNTCVNLIHIPRKTRCDSCAEKVKNRTLFDISKRKDVYSSRYAGVRQHAKIVTRDWDASCKICGYRKHVEICHIKPISSFKDRDRLTDVNNPSNLILLCPNHHWELDHGMLLW